MDNLLLGVSFTVLWARASGTGGSGSVLLLAEVAVMHGVTTLVVVASQCFSNPAENGMQLQKHPKAWCPRVSLLWRNEGSTKGHHERSATSSKGEWPAMFGPSFGCLACQMDYKPAV
jgi:hypothetical protein